MSQASPFNELSGQPKVWKGHDQPTLNVDPLKASLNREMSGIYRTSADYERGLLEFEGRCGSGLYTGLSCMNNPTLISLMEERGDDSSKPNCLASAHAMGTTIASMQI